MRPHGLAILTEHRLALRVTHLHLVADHLPHIDHDDRSTIRVSLECLPTRLLPCVRPPQANQLVRHVDAERPHVEVRMPGSVTAPSPLVDPDFVAERRDDFDDLPVPIHRKNSEFPVAAFFAKRAPCLV